MPSERALRTVTALLALAGVGVAACAELTRSGQATTADEI
jgi:hypothetical protein